MVTKVQATAKETVQETAQTAVPVSVDTRKLAADVKSLTVEERMERGRALRARVPRSSHTFWALAIPPTCPNAAKRRHGCSLNRLCRSRWVC